MAAVTLEATDADGTEAASAEEPVGSMEEPGFTAVEDFMGVADSTVAVDLAAAVADFTAVVEADSTAVVAMPEVGMVADIVNADFQI